MTDDRVLYDVDSEKRIATITFNNPSQRNSYDAAMRDTVARYLDRVAEDDDITVVLLRGADGVFGQFTAGDEPAEGQRGVEEGLVVLAAGRVPDGVGLPVERGLQVAAVACDGLGGR